MTMDKQRHIKQCRGSLRINKKVGLCQQHILKMQN